MKLTSFLEVKKKVFFRNRLDFCKTSHVSAGFNICIAYERMCVCELDICGVVAKVLDCDIVVSEFELLSRYRVHFRSNNIGKSMNLLIPQLSVKLYHYCSSARVASTLISPRRLIGH